MRKISTFALGCVLTLGLVACNNNVGSNGATVQNSVTTNSAKTNESLKSKLIMDPVPNGALYSITTNMPDNLSITPDQRPVYTVTYTVVNGAGTISSVTYGPSLGMGPDSDYLSNDTCSGHFMSNGQSCSFQVHLVPVCQACIGGIIYGLTNNLIHVYNDSSVSDRMYPYNYTILTNTAPSITSAPEQSSITVQQGVPTAANSTFYDFTNQSRYQLCTIPQNLDTFSQDIAATRFVNSTNS